MKRICACLLTCLLVLGVAGCPAKVFTDQRGIPAQIDDAGIAGTIKTDLMKAHLGQSGDVNVYCFSGQVFLVGQVDEKFRDLAVKKARETRGVTKVTTKWFPVGSANLAADTALETQIDAALLGAKGVRSNQVSVDVWGANVVLLGLVADSAQISKAGAAALSVKGVKSVTNLLMVHP